MKSFAIIRDKIKLFIKNIVDFFGIGYKKFIKEHSISIKKLEGLNLKFTFNDIQNYKMVENYDNQIFFNSISPEDYLTYQLIYKRKEIQALINQADYNKMHLDLYKEEVAKIFNLGTYDTDAPKNTDLLIKIEKKLFEQMIKKPAVDFYIWVRLMLTNIKGSYITLKSEKIDKDRIKTIIERMKDRNGDFYNDREIWDSICRVERGRVTNKIRFAVYARDDYRCVMCGRKNVDLEVDHIFPIAKGGKSNFDNLQTLCHRCNALKSDTIVKGAVDPRLAKKANPHSSTPVCPNCNIPMVLRKGTYGEFYGCRNYPNCKHTEHI